MDSLAVLRTLGGLLTVLAILVGALWAARRFNLAIPAGKVRTRRRLQVVERLGLDPRRSVILLRCYDREHLVLLGPEGPLLIDGKVRVALPCDDIVEDLPAASPFALRGSFAGLVERARGLTPGTKQDVSNA